MMIFKQSLNYTLGVEVEFQIVDRSTWNLTPLAPAVLASVPPSLCSNLSSEFIQSIVEIQTGICSSVVDVENDLVEIIGIVEGLAERNNCSIFAASLHPFANYQDQLLTSDERYKDIMQELQIIGRQFISQGLHVHVGMPDGDTAIRVCNRIQVYLPLLLALSTSSPYSQGEDTGLMSYRTKLFDALPLAGSYFHIQDWHDFSREVGLLQRMGVINSIRDLWWDVRPNPDFGTVEIRICDLPTRFTDILGICAVIQALGATLAEDTSPCQPLSPYIIQANKWQATRHGLHGFFVDPVEVLSSGRVLFAEAIEALLQYIEPMACQFNLGKYIDFVNRILKEGTGSDSFRRQYMKHKNFPNVIQALQGDFWR